MTSQAPPAGAAAAPSLNEQQKAAMLHTTPGTKQTSQSVTPEAAKTPVRNNQDKREREKPIDKGSPNERPTQKPNKDTDADAAAKRDANKNPEMDMAAAAAAAKLARARAIAIAAPGSKGKHSITEDPTGHQPDPAQTAIVPKKQITNGAATTDKATIRFTPTEGATKAWHQRFSDPDKHKSVPPLSVSSLVRSVDQVAETIVMMNGWSNKTKAEQATLLMQQKTWDDFVVASRKITVTKTISQRRANFASAFVVSCAKTPANLLPEAEISDSTVTLPRTKESLACKASIVHYGPAWKTINDDEAEGNMEEEAIRKEKEGQLQTTANEVAPKATQNKTKDITQLHSKPDKSSNQWTKVTNKCTKANKEKGGKIAKQPKNPLPRKEVYLQLNLMAPKCSSDGTWTERNNKMAEQCNEILNPIRDILFKFDKDAKLMDIKENDRSKAKPLNTTKKGVNFDVAGNYIQNLRGTRDGVDAVIHGKIAVRTEKEVQPLVDKLETLQCLWGVQVAKVQALNPEEAVFLEGCPCESANLPRLREAIEDRLTQIKETAPDWELEKGPIRSAPKKKTKEAHKPEDQELQQHAIHVLAAPEHLLKTQQVFIQHLFPRKQVKQDSILGVGARAVPCLSSSAAAPIGKDNAIFAKYLGRHCATTWTGDAKNPARVQTATTNLIKNLDAKVPGCGHTLRELLMVMKHPESSGKFLFTNVDHMVTSPNEVIFTFRVTDAAICMQAINALPLVMDRHVKESWDWFHVWALSQMQASHCRDRATKRWIPRPSYLFAQLGIDSDDEDSEEEALDSEIMEKIMEKHSRQAPKAPTTFVIENIGFIFKDAQTLGDDMMEQDTTGSGSTKTFQTPPPLEEMEEPSVQESATPIGPINYNEGFEEVDFEATGSVASDGSRTTQKTLNTMESKTDAGSTGTLRTVDSEETVRANAKAKQAVHEAGQSDSEPEEAPDDRKDQPNKDEDNEGGIPYEDEMYRYQQCDTLGTLSKGMRKEGREDKANSFAVSRTQGFHLDFATLFSAKEREKSAWKRMPQAQLEQIWNAHAAEWCQDMSEQDESLLQECLLEILLPVHVEVEEYAPHTFLPRVINSRPEQIQHAVETFKRTKESTLKAQSEIPLGLFSNCLWTDDHCKHATLIMQESIPEDWEPPSLMHTTEEKLSSEWKDLNLEDTNKFVDDCHKACSDLPTDEKTRLKVVTWIVFRYLRIHMEVEGLDRESFTPRVIKLNILQLEENAEWLLRNPKGVQVISQALIPPQNENPLCLQHSLGDTNGIKDKQTIVWIIESLRRDLAKKGETDIDGDTDMPDKNDDQDQALRPSLKWERIPKMSIKAMKMVVRKIWESNPEYQPIVKTYLIKGWLAIHMDGEGLPFETFYQRIYAFDPELWTDALDSLLKFCRDGSSPAAGAAGAK